MTIERPDLIGERTGLYDDTGSLYTERAFDVTEHFKKVIQGDRVILSYVTSTEGEVMILSTNESGHSIQDGVGISMALLVKSVIDGDEWTFKRLESKAKRLGIHRDLLAEIIITHATHEEID